MAGQNVQHSPCQPDPHLRHVVEGELAQARAVDVVRHERARVLRQRRRQAARPGGDVRPGLALRDLVG